MKTVKLFCLVNDQGTACSETVLCAEHCTDKNKATVEAMVSRDPNNDAIPGKWHDCSENDYDGILCSLCGASNNN